MKKWLIRASFALNILVFAGAISLVCGSDKLASKYFLQPMQDRWTSQFDVLPVRSNDIVFLGDSITEGGAWEELFPGLPVRNRGIGGDVTEGVLKRLHEVTDGKPAKVFLLIGTNDLASKIAVEDIAANIGRIVDSISAASPDTKIVVQSVLPRETGFREKVEALNRLLEQTVAGKADWINLYPLFLDSDDGSIRDALSNDELHLLGPGYLLWRDAISAHVRQ